MTALCRYGRGFTRNSRVREILFDKLSLAEVLDARFCNKLHGPHREPKYAREMLVEIGFPCLNRFTNAADPGPVL
jgi:hypothetical protein